MTPSPEQWLRDVVEMKERGMTPTMDKQQMLNCADEIEEVCKAAVTMYVALRRVETWLQAVFGPNDFTDMRKKVRKAILAGEEVGL